MVGLPLAGGDLGAQTHAQATEFNFGIQISPAFLIPPELEYLRRRRSPRSRRTAAWADQNHLTRIFRRFTGMSPHRWRRSMAPA